jgi:hypothetical protein
VQATLRSTLNANNLHLLRRLLLRKTRRVAGLFGVSPLGKVEPVKCFFCSNKAVHSCSWPVEKPTSISHWDLTEEHVVVTQQTKRHLRPLTVRRFNMWSLEQLCTVPVTMYAIRFPDDRYFVYYLYGRDRVEVLNPASCANRVCEAHVRELGDEAFCCMEHWDAWRHVDLAADQTAVAGRMSA